MSSSVRSFQCGRAERRARALAAAQWLLPTVTLAAVAAIGGSPGTRIAAGVVLLLLAALRMAAPSRARTVEAANASEAFGERERFMIAAASAPGDIAAIRFNEYRALARIDQGHAETAVAALHKRLVSAVGEAVPVARVERDILAILPGEASNAAPQLDALRYTLCQPLVAGAETIRPTVAIGVAPAGACAATSLEQAIWACDAATGVEPGASAAGVAAAPEDVELEQQLAAAIAAGELALHYQPIFDIAAGRVVGAEALLRWRSPTRGDVSPAVFVPILERSKLIEDAGLWALSTACRDARSWIDAGLDLAVAVNVSARQIQDARLGDAVLRTLARNGLPPAKLELELTETAAMGEMERTRALFAELRGHGVHLSIDDFGNGYSNLNYLRSLSFDKLKIDRQFVTGVDARPDSEAICRAVVTLARGLGLDLLAEGVERVEEADTLRNMGCGLFQGYYFGRPMPGADFVAFVEDGDRQRRLASPVHRQLAALDQRLAS